MEVDDLRFKMRDAKTREDAEADEDDHHKQRRAAPFLKLEFPRAA
jgi:hypothetical protein